MVLMVYKSKVSRFLVWSAHMAGRPMTFIVALLLLFIWLLCGFIWGFSTTWLLVVNTIATINASLMVFVIQNTQYREGKALHIKIDELLRKNKETMQELIAIEEMEEEELEQIREKIYQDKKE